MTQDIDALCGDQRERQPDLIPGGDAGRRGLVPSQVMMDQITTVRRDRCGPKIGHIDRSALLMLADCLPS